MYWLVLPINPEPWAIGPVGIHRAGGKVGAHVGRNIQLASFQEAVRESTLQWLEEHGLKAEDVLIQGLVELKFFFWRRLDSYQRDGKSTRKHQVDVTNMQKATEDALAGIFYANDRQVIHCDSFLMADQSGEVEPMIVIGVGATEYPDARKVIPAHVNLDALDRGDGPAQDGLFSTKPDYDDEVF